MPLQGNADAVLVKVVWQRFGFSVRHGDRRLCGGRAGRTAGQSRTGRCAGPVRPGRAIPVWPRCGQGCGSGIRVVSEGRSPGLRRWPEQIGRHVLRGAGRGGARNEGQFIFWTRKAAEQGHALAQGNLGWAYEEGRGVGRDARWPQNGTARPIWGCPGWRRPGIRQPSSEWAICISWAWVCPKVKKRGWRGSARQPRQAASRHRPNWAPCTPGEVA